MCIEPRHQNVSCRVTLQMYCTVLQSKVRVSCPAQVNPWGVAFVGLAAGNFLTGMGIMMLVFICNHK